MAATIEDDSLAQYATFENPLSFTEDDICSPDFFGVDKPSLNVEAFATKFKSMTVEEEAKQRSSCDLVRHLSESNTH
jgi:hypothetical protein